MTARITLATSLIPTRRRRWVYWHPIAEFFVCLFAAATLVAAAWFLKGVL